jgi:hypothetical protein
LQQSDAKIGGQFSEVARVLVHALVRIHAHRSRVRQPKGAAGHEPVLNQVMGQALTQLELQGFVEPALAHIEDQQCSGDQSKNAQLVDEFSKIPARQRIIEGLVPGIEPNLAVCGHRNDEKYGARQ